MNSIKNYVDNYIINRFTMAILPDSSNMYSQILEYEDDLIVQKRPIEIIDDSCRYFGSSYVGRKEGTKDLIRVTHKSPIVIDPANSIYFFPTTSSTRPNCIWVSHDYVKEYSRAEHDNTMITFKNGKQITIPISQGSFEKQLFRTSYLSTIISSRIEQEQRKLNMLLFPNGEKEVNTLYDHIIREITRKL
ncbi:competence protein ComK [Metabacillus sediminilitoris]|uniref:Competence protein n=1 Tax=Metabacillus sediminilitoris TaxID=2567941 RepID=A0A4S4BY93_9BACI|nr:competence protein ComK [Metabacillus sediminilitoris]QGQ44595.1 competence protein [Metabacillus sediminilitoris]THF80222.1 competence protein [Metabacillus sediminilitoris]